MDYEVFAAIDSYDFITNGTSHDIDDLDSLQIK